MHGGKQIRPNIHIDDMCKLYEFLIKTNKKNVVYNAGFENLSIIDIAKQIKKKYHVKLILLKALMIQEAIGLILRK